MATRLYFPVDDLASVAPTIDAGWNYTSEDVTRAFHTVKGTSPITVGTTIGPLSGTAGQKGIDRQYVSPPMKALTISGTVKLQLMVREYATQDNMDQIILKLYVVSEDGTSVTGTLLALGSYAVTGEFINNATHRNKKGADGDTVTSVAVNENDRLVLEIGYSNSGSGTSPEASAKWGENATDLPEDETQTTDGAGWLEISDTITFKDDPRMYSGVHRQLMGSSEV